jgi:capsular polysaccharide transport system permease protein
MVESNPLESNQLPPPERSPLAVMLAVWKALFLRELLNRIARERTGWIWMLAEPVAHIAIISLMITQGFRARTVAGGDPVIFIMLGILGFFLVRNIMNRGIDAVESASNLYAFRQIKPVDTVFVRAFNTGFLEILIFLLIFAGAGLLGHPIVPGDPLRAMSALFGLWVLGLGLALTLSIPCVLVPEFGHTVRLMMTPLYFFSAVIFPSVKMPPSIREYLMWNPILHALESLRLGFMPTYVVPPGISLPFVYACAIPLVFTGLALHVQYRKQLLTR